MTVLQAIVTVSDASGTLPWLLEGSEDSWLSVPVFRRVWLYRCYLVSIVQTASFVSPLTQSGAIE